MQVRDVYIMSGARTAIGDFGGALDQMLAQGASVGQLSQIITALNDSITQRAILLVMSELGKPAVDCTWLAFGSEGRAEQTLKTDQDNALLFITPAGKTAEATRLELLPLAQRINQALNEIGFPLFPRNNMASNPAYCLSMEEWQARFGQWIEHGTLEQLRGATIFCDFRPVFGTAAHANNLRQWVFERTAGNPRSVDL